jgi:FixJ family two-component response regulator
MPPRCETPSSFLLEVEGFKVRTFASPDELLNDNELPDLGCLILDHQMPAMSGPDVVVKLRQRQNPMPAVLITAHPDAKILERTSAAGVTLIKKPFQQAVLLVLHPQIIVLDGSSPTTRGCCAGDHSQGHRHRNLACPVSH